MAEFEHLTKEKLDVVIDNLWEVESSLNGLAGLFQTRENPGDACIDTDALYGIGHNLKLIANKVSTLEDILRCGYDSRAITKDSIVKEIAKKKLEASDYIEEALDNFERKDEE